MQTDFRQCSRPVVEELGEVARPGSAAGHALSSALDALALMRVSDAPSAACVPSTGAQMALDQVFTAASSRCQRYWGDGAVPRLLSPGESATCTRCCRARRQSNGLSES